MIVKADHPMLQYSGRIDRSSIEAPVLVYPCSYIKMKFSGTCVSAVVENHKAYFGSYLGYFIDGEQGCVKLSESGREAVMLADGLSDGVHEVMLFKRMDGCHTFTFYGFEIEDGARLCEVEPKPARRIEVYGDSVSAGEVSEAIDCVGQPDPEHDGEYSNSYYSYAWMTARRLGAEIHDIAQGGVALLDGTGWFAEPDYMGMESIYDKIRYYPESTELVKWDFDAYRPHVVIVAIGQNDANPDNYMALDYKGEKAERWRNAYRAFLEKLREIYPEAEIILTTTILEHDANWDRAIGEVCDGLGDARIHHFLYSRNGTGTPGHIRIPEAEQMAEELAGFIESLGEEVWCDECGCGVGMKSNG